MPGFSFAWSLEQVPLRERYGMAVLRKGLLKIGQVKREVRSELHEQALSQQALLRGSREFEIPYNRQELADYLGVDRSAMSNELGKLKAEGVLDYRRNWFGLRK